MGPEGDSAFGVSLLRITFFLLRAISSAGLVASKTYFGQLPHCKNPILYGGSSFSRVATSADRVHLRLRGWSPKFYTLKQKP